MINHNEVVDFASGDVRTLLFRGDAELVPVVRRENEFFTKTALKAYDKLGLDAVVNGEQYEISKAAWGPLAMRNSAPPSATTTIGEVINDGRTITGRSSPLTFFVSQSGERAGDLVESFGMGNPPQASAAGFGGGVPLIVNGLKYGSSNAYSKTLPDAPMVGDPGKYSGDLVQRSNSGFAAYEKEYERNGNYETGKVILAYSSKADTFALVVQMVHEQAWLFLPFGISCSPQDSIMPLPLMAVRRQRWSEIGQFKLPLKCTKMRPLTSALGLEGSIND